MPKATVYIGLGSNLERPVFQLKKAFNRLAHHPALQLVDYSSIYETDPQGYTDQPVFYNAVARITTNYRPHALLDLLQSIEFKHHRKRTSNQNSPRTLDLDMLLYNQLNCSTDRLTLPHPRLLERRFVLAPLLEISPAVHIPGKGFALNYSAAVQNQGCQLKARILLS